MRDYTRKTSARDLDDLNKQLEKYTISISNKIEEHIGNEQDST